MTNKPKVHRNKYDYDTVTCSVLRCRNPRSMQHIIVYEDGEELRWPVCDPCFQRHADPENTFNLDTYFGGIVHERDYGSSEVSEVPEGDQGGSIS